MKTNDQELLTGLHVDEFPAGILIFRKQPETNSIVCTYYNEFANHFLSIESLTDDQIAQYLELDFLIEKYPLTKELFFSLTNRWGLLEITQQGDDRFIVLITDITVFKKREEELSREVARLQLINKDLESFAYIAAHDLKEPARKVTAFGERFLEKTKEITYSEEQLLFLTKMMQHSTRMYQLIDYILDFSKHTRKMEYFENVDLNVLLQEVLQEIQLVIKQRNPELQIELLPCVQGDRMQLIGIFKNILLNSLKYYRPDEPLRIQIQPYQPTEEDLIREHLDTRKSYVGVTIRDNGIGFTENDSRKIFHLFERLRGKKDTNGVGLGLAICKRLIDNHGGAIWAKSQLNRGAEFTLLLPKPSSI